MRKTTSERLDILEKDMREVKICMAHIEGKLGNGLESRVRQIEKMQWWQIGILVAIIAGLVGGMWTMLRQGSVTTRENQRILREHIERTEPMLEYFRGRLE